MRVIAGKFRGAKLFSLKGDATRPTADMVKESMFNIIQSHFPCGCVLDLFAGSGGLGFEAISRGAEFCVFVENNRQAVNIIRKNAEHLKLSSSEYKIEPRDFMVYIKSTTEKFDVIFLDPPYNQGYLSKAINIIRDNNILTDNGILVIESEVDGEEIGFDGFEVKTEKKYGRILITVLRGSGKI